MKNRFLIAGIGAAILIGIIVTILLFISSEKNKNIESSNNANTPTSVETTQTPVPSATVAPSPEPTPYEPKGEILFNKKADLDGDNIDEDISILKIIKDNKQYEAALKIRGKTESQLLPFVTRDDNITIGAFKSVDFVDIDGDSKKDVIILIPETSEQFNSTSFFAYNFSKQKSFTCDVNNKSFISELIDNFKFSYEGNGKLMVLNDSYGFKADINIANTQGYSDSEDTNKSIYDKSWIENPPMEIDDNFRLSLIKDDKNNFIKIPFPVLGQSSYDIIGEIDAYFGFNGEFMPVLRKLDAVEFDGVNKKITYSKVLN